MSVRFSHDNGTSGLTSLWPWTVMLALRLHTSRLRSGSIIGSVVTAPHWTPL